MLTKVAFCQQTLSVFHLQLLSLSSKTDKNTFPILLRPTAIQNFIKIALHLLFKNIVEIQLRIISTKIFSKAYPKSPISRRYF